VCGAEGYTPLTINTILVFADNGVAFGVIAVTVIGALVSAYFAADAATRVTFN